jgi:hypothetical protein
MMIGLWQKLCDRRKKLEPKTRHSGGSFLCDTDGVSRTHPAERSTALTPTAHDEAFDELRMLPRWTLDEPWVIKKATCTHGANVIYWVQ